MTLNLNFEPLQYYVKQGTLNHFYSIQQVSPELFLDGLVHHRRGVTTGDGLFDRFQELIQLAQHGRALVHTQGGTPLLLSQVTNDHILGHFTVPTGRSS